MHIAVIGAGYVGLTTSLCLASLGNQVSVYDIDKEKIDLLAAGECPIHEPGLLELLHECQEEKSVRFEKDLSAALAFATIVFLCVPTPQDEDGSADLTYVLEAAKACSDKIQSGSVVVTKSTVPVGSAARVIRTLNRPDVHVAANPEFLREGCAIADFMQPDRIVIGSDSTEAIQVLRDLYKNISAPVLVTSPASAELIKYASNAFLAIKLSFINEIASLCEKTEGDIDAVSIGMGLDTRIGKQFLKAGPGWGGSCFPKDTQALNYIGESAGLSLPLVSAAIESNEKSRKRVVERVSSLLSGELEGRVIAIWGLAFKANTDDTRDSPALAAISRLTKRGASVRAYDPAAKVTPTNFTRCSSSLDAVKDADALLIMTEWAEFTDVDPKKVRDLMRGDVVLDARRILKPETWSREFKNFNRLGT